MEEEERRAAQRLLQRVARGGPPLTDAELELVLRASHRDEVEVDLVMVSAVVVDKKNEPVTGLSKADFRLTEDGQPRPVAWFGEDEDLPFRVLLLLDVSGSMAEKGKTAAIRAALLPLMREIRRRDRVKLVAFASDAVVEFTDWNNMPMTTLDRALRLPRAGRTALADALNKAAGLLTLSPKERLAIVLVSDGIDNASTLAPEQAIIAARAVEAPVYVYALGGLSREIQDRRRKDGSPMVALRQIAEETGGRYFLIGGLEEAEQARDAARLLRRDLRHQYWLAFRPESPPDGAFHPIGVEVDRSGARVRSRQGYRRDPPSK